MIVFWQLMKRLSRQIISLAQAEALKVALKAYAPYSGFRVGAALIMQDYTIYTGSNVENRSYGLTICAERVAIATAITHGRKDFLALILYTPDASQAIPPCGACRQVISEFTSPSFPIYFTKDGKRFIKKTIAQLYPFDSLHELAK